MFKTRELQAFDAYMRLGGMKLTAEHLDMSQPMVSRLLSSLEKKAGFELFQRKRNRLAPTAEAFRFHQTVMHHLAGLRNLEQEASAIASGQVGHLVIAAQPVFCDTFLLDALSHFRKEHPQATVQIADVGMAEMLRMISEQRCDLAFGITLNAEAFGGEALSLAHCEAKCILPKGHALEDIEDIPLPRLRREMFIDLSQGSPLRRRIDLMMETIQVHRTIAAELRTIHGIVRLVERGEGIAIVDPVAHQLLDLELVSVHRLIPSITWDIAQFVPHGRPLSTVGQAFAAGVANEIARLKQAGVVT
ncbi:MAG TPA: LysR family transcriptional regulator [Sulfitobacter sp.]|jgi:DNA-binding transcriptional LysR family regulator|uniref:Octopine catabolism/uptake operon regulatory protein OccR n=1 Tax=Sulfitobacter dubius TaxID=218673 RepID=A0ABY3ZQK4_9RHOB|nr:LysR family transcriptional regulator [Sulfitobacter dubius]MBM06478.1 LysR family transcriptional regulator [Sulfitobacter sp.]UOA16449.1 Octopine catabolism/uptake operon regulatory protein OccR [Sulfitobacter dubius]SFH36231.1 DNA-binding transcriptional regulator, LysR family [Sulfitobacter dubius]HBB85054.1 LysR family transcriptional regulator [Sulfitobacter sp.]|tara:strand:- start:973 stop:1884 length:912 start_codon:yes stop_codon:yes gene_type:complete